MSLKRIILIVGIIAIIMVVSGYIFRDYLSDEYAELPKSNVGQIAKNERLLVIAPHSDDETLGCAGYIKKVLAKNGVVKVVIVTNGDGSISSAFKLFFTVDPTPQEYLNLGRLRHRESLAALAELGVPKENILFLGYPDRGTSALWSSNWTEDKPFRDPFTKVKQSPYSFSYSSGTIYSGENEARDLQRIIKEFKPTVMLFPHPDDHHQDHRSTFAFVKFALEQAGLQKVPKELVYLVHYKNWPVPFGKHTSRNLTPPRSLSNLSYKWDKLSLSKKEAQNKRKAIQLYKSQIKAMADFLYSFDRRNELYVDYQDVKLNSRLAKTIIENPQSDYFLGLLQAFGGIKNIQVQNLRNGVALNLNIRNKITPNYTYILDMTYFNENEKPEKFSIVVNGKQVSKLVRVQNKLQPADIMVRKNNNSISVKVKYPQQVHFKNLLVSARIVIKGMEIDRTAWKLIYF